MRPARGEVAAELGDNGARLLAPRIGGGEDKPQPDRGADLQLAQPLPRHAGNAQPRQPVAAVDQVTSLV